MIEKVKRPAAITPSVSQEPGRGVGAPNPKEIYDGSTNLRETVPSYCSRIKVRSAIQRWSADKSLLIPSQDLDGPYPSRVSLQRLERFLRPLADHADQRKLTCFPSVETLARETQVSVRGVQYALRKLEAAGAILTERSRGRSSSLYRLMIPPTLPRIAPLNPARIAPLNPAKDCTPNRAIF